MSATTSVDHILVIGFGGPTKPEELKPFLEQVARGAQIHEARLQDVLRHYEAVGGRSRYNEETFKLVGKLEERLRELDVTLPVFVGMRNWHPFLQDVMARIKARGLTRGVGMVLAPHRAASSYDKYLKSVEDAKTAAGAPDITYRYLPAWHDHPLFIEAQADQVRRVLEVIPEAEREATHLLFSAHSIPIEQAQRSRYTQEVEQSSRGVAERLGYARWSFAYQSRSGSPSQPWLEPSVESAIRGLKAQDVRRVMVIPVGFLCDNVEVLFDLDVEARTIAEKAGLEFSRASTVQDHPKFVEMFAQLTQEAIAQRAIA